MSRSGSSRLTPLYRQLIELSSGPEPIPGQAPISKADAFVLTHAIAGVIRTFVVQDDQLPPREEIEKSLTRLVLGFMNPDRAA